VTVLVTGASGLVGEATVRAFLGRDEVRATVRRPETAEPLRALGAKVSVRAADRVEVLAEVLGGVHTVVHLIGGPNEPDADAVSAANHGTTLAALEAARLTGVRRFLFVSVPDADPRSADPFLRAKGLAEQAIAASGLEHAIVRAAPVYGLGGLWFAALVEGALAEPPFVVGDPDREVAPLFVDDLAEALALLDDLEGPLEGTYALPGAAAGAGRRGPRPPARDGGVADGRGVPGPGRSRAGLHVASGDAGLGAAPYRPRRRARPHARPRRAPTGLGCGLSVKRRSSASKARDPVLSRSAADPGSSVGT
jgi:NADH dehydrogenase